MEEYSMETVQEEQVEEACELPLEEEETPEEDLTLEVEELTLEEVRRALLEKKGTVWGRNAKVLHCARSAFTKWKKKRAFRRYPKAVLYLIGAWGLDLLKRIGLVRGNQGRYFVREGVFVDDTH